MVFLLIIQALLNRTKTLVTIAEPKPRGFWLQGVLLYGTFPFTIALTPLVQGSAFEHDALVIADAMVGVALFAVVPLWLAAILSLRTVKTQTL